MKLSTILTHDLEMCSCCVTKFKLCFFSMSLEESNIHAKYCIKVMSPNHTQICDILQVLINTAPEQ